MASATRMNGIETLLQDVRNRSELEAADGGIFKLVTGKQGLVRANYDGFVQFMKVVFNVFGDSGFVSHGCMIAPSQLLRIRMRLSLMRLDAIKLGSPDGAERIQHFAHKLITASDGQKRAIAVVFFDCEDPNNSALVEQGFVKHLRDFELNIAVGETLFDDCGLDECVAYRKASRALTQYGYPRLQIFRKVLGNLARDDAASALALSQDEVRGLRKRFRRKILDIGLTPQQYSMAYSGISSTQDCDIAEYRRDYRMHSDNRSPSNRFKIGAKRFNLRACLNNAKDYERKSVPVDKASAMRLDEFLAAGWIVEGDELKWRSHFQGETNIPVRIRLKDFSLSKHQKRVLKKNQFLRSDVKRSVITDAECALFESYKFRLVGTATESLFDAVPDMSSNEIKAITFSDGDRLVAASYLVIGKTSTYSMFAMHDPTRERNSLGILTILKEIEYSVLHGKEYYYLGPVHAEPSYYDYKKRFHALEISDGKGKWTNYARLLG